MLILSSMLRYIYLLLQQFILLSTGPSDELTTLRCLSYKYTQTSAGVKGLNGWLDEWLSRNSQSWSGSFHCCKQKKIMHTETQFFPWMRRFLFFSLLIDKIILQTPITLQTWGAFSTSDERWLQNQNIHFQPPLFGTTQRNGFWTQGVLQIRTRYHCSSF